MWNACSYKTDKKVISQANDVAIHSINQDKYVLRSSERNKDIWIFPR